MEVGTRREARKHPGSNKMASGTENSFVSVLQQFSTEVTEKFSLSIAFNPEDQLKASIETLLVTTQTLYLDFKLLKPLPVVLENFIRIDIKSFILNKPNFSEFTEN